MSENTFWVLTWAIVGAVAIVFIIFGAGCERELNKLKNQTYHEAIEKGCTVITGNKIHLICNK